MSFYGPKKTKVTGQELAVTDEMRAQVFWLIRKYTSITYLRRMHFLYANFVRGYEDYARAQSDNTKWYRDNLASLYAYLASLDRGLDTIARGYRTGYASIREGVFFAEYIQSRRFEYGMENIPIGYQYPPAPQERLYAWVDVALVMAGKVWLTLDAVWAFPRVLDPGFGPYTFPAKLDPLPAPSGRLVETDNEIDVSGVWLPIDVPNGCPNYLIAGHQAPPVTRVNERLDYPDFPGGRGNEPVPAYTEYDYVREPARWALLWEDDRYQNGQIPDESAYLDATTAPPPWPPAA